MLMRVDVGYQAFERVRCDEQSDRLESDRLEERRLNGSADQVPFHV